MVTILVIEDDPVLLQSVVENLQSAGFEAEGYASSVKGVARAQALLPDLILCDILMPDLNGYDVLSELRNDPATATIPFVFLSALGTRDNIREGMNLGADDYVSKPFTSSELISTIRSRLKRQQKNNEKFSTTLNLLRTNIIYAVPHELRTPLQQILGFSSLLAEDPDSWSSAEVKDMAGTIYNASRRLQRLFENYLVYAQIELILSDEKMLQSIRHNILADPVDVIREVGMSLAESYGRQADFEFEGYNLAIGISRADMRQIATTLLDNAFKFSQAGNKVQVHTFRDHKGYTVQIRDHGIGMTAEQKGNIGAYMQFNRALYEQQGVGLGLIIAKRLSELYCAKFDIQSSLGQGTLITIQFPL